MAELEIDQNLAVEFDKITEAGTQLVPLSGPGYVLQHSAMASCRTNACPIAGMWALATLATLATSTACCKCCGRFLRCGSGMGTQPPVSSGPHRVTSRLTFPLSSPRHVPGTALLTIAHVGGPTDTMAPALRAGWDGTADKQDGVPARGFDPAYGYRFGCQWRWLDSDPGAQIVHVSFSTMQLSAAACRLCAGHEGGNGQRPAAGVQDPGGQGPCRVQFQQAAGWLLLGFHACMRAYMCWGWRVGRGIANGRACWLSSHHPTCACRMHRSILLTF